MIPILCLSLLQLGFVQAAPILDRSLAAIQEPLPNFNIELKTEILSMALEDQTARFEIADFKNVSEEEIKHISEIAARHNLRLKEIISVYGWPGTQLVGLEGENSFWLLVQHQDHDLEFQKQCLALLKEAVEKQDAQLRHYAYLLDRVRKNENLPQVYGTQWDFKEGQISLYPVESPENLNQLRLEAGLNSIEEYQEQIQKIYQ